MSRWQQKIEQVDQKINQLQRGILRFRIALAFYLVNGIMLSMEINTIGNQTVSSVAIFQFILSTSLLIIIFKLKTLHRIKRYLFSMFLGFTLHYEIMGLWADFKYDDPALLPPVYPGGWYGAVFLVGLAFYLIYRTFQAEKIEQQERIISQAWKVS